jgi:alkylhydroperoxidase family enzyme
MKTHLKLVSDNPIPGSNFRPDGRALHQLADRLTEEIHAGHPEDAHFLASLQKLSPFGVAVVATWMAKAGVSEAEILEVVV